MIKNPKMYDQFTQAADQYWRDEILPQLEVEFQADSEQQLREKIKDHGRSFDTISQTARKSWMAEGFLHAKLKDKTKVELPEIRKYYYDHQHDQEFDRPSQIAWREIVVDVRRYPGRDERAEGRLPLPGAPAAARTSPPWPGPRAMVPPARANRAASCRPRRAHMACRASMRPLADPRDRPGQRHPRGTHELPHRPGRGPPQRWARRVRRTLRPDPLHPRREEVPDGADRLHREALGPDSRVDHVRQY